MKNILSFVLFTSFACYAFGQTQNLMVSGLITQSDGTSVEGVSLFMPLAELEQDYAFAYSDDNGYYEFNIDVSEENLDEVCTELYMFDCGNDFILETICFDDNSLVHVHDFQYCTAGTDTCFVSVLFFPLSEDSIELFTINTGLAPFQYEWSTGELSESIVVSSTSINQFCVTVTDAQNCVSTECIDLLPPDPCFVVISEEQGPMSTILHADANGISNYFDYLWNDGSDGSSIEIFDSGEYCVTITDESGCTNSDCRYIEVDSSNWVDCYSFIYQLYDAEQGEITLEVFSEGAAPFTYLWGNGDTSSNLILEDEGEYCVTVTDSENCESEYCGYYDLFSDCTGFISVTYFNDNTAELEFTHFGVPFPDSLDYSYLWSTGEEESSISVSEDNEYCVTVTGQDGCSFVECIDYYDIFGGSTTNILISYTDSGNGDLVEGNIEIYKILGNSELILTSHICQPLPDEGFYVVNDLPYGSYIFRAIPNVSENYVPSYAMQTVFWDEADVIDIFENNELEVINIQTVNIEENVGEGGIAGSVFDSGFYESIYGLNIMVFQGNEAVRQQTTYEDGSFQFYDLDWGTYDVILEVPGKERQVITVIVSADQPNVLDVLFNEVAVTSTTEVDDNLISTPLLSPNPSSNWLTADLESAVDAAITYSVIDINGKLIYNKNEEIRIGANSFQIDISAYSEGIYFLTFTTRQGISTQRFMKIN